MGQDDHGGRSARRRSRRWGWAMMLGCVGLLSTGCGDLFNMDITADPDTVEPIDETSDSSQSDAPAEEVPADPAIAPNTTVPAQPDTPNPDDQIPNLGSNPPAPADQTTAADRAAPIDEIGLEIESAEDERAIANLPDLVQVIRGAGGCCQIAIPGDWRFDQGLHDSAEIKVSNQAEGLYLIVLMDLKRGQHEPNLGLQSTAYQENFRAYITNTTGVQYTPLEQIAGYSAIQVRMSGRYQGLDVTYFHTTVETPRAYYQILAWTASPQFRFYRFELQSIIRSFRPYSEGF